MKNLSVRTNYATKADEKIMELADLLPENGRKIKVHVAAEYIPNMNSNDPMALHDYMCYIRSVRNEGGRILISGYIRDLVTKWRRTFTYDLAGLGYTVIASVHAQALEAIYQNPELASIA